MQNFVSSPRRFHPAFLRRLPHFKLIETVFAVALLAVFVAGAALAQSTSGRINGVVKDPTGALVPGATVTLDNPVSGYTRTTTSDSSGEFHFFNIPYNPYSLAVKTAGFQKYATEVQVSSSVPMALPVTLQLASSAQTVTVNAPVDLVESDPTAHTDVDRSLINKLPIESESSGLSAIVTEASPGVAADSNGLMHGLGDHAENSFNVDGQPITDQQSKVFSNQLPVAAVQSLEVIEGAPPAEYGDKTSLVVKVTTRSGEGVTSPTGSVTASYGAFGSSKLGFDVAYGGKNWGNFVAASAMQSGRFLDTPEYTVLHDKGNEENFFDRVDRQLGPKDSVHADLQYTRSWFQTPNDFENYDAYGQNNGVGNTDQRSKIGTIDISPTYTHIVNDSIVTNFGVYLRRDAYNYYPSNNPLADYALDQQQESVAQQRSLTNTGTHADISYVHGVNNVKIGGMYEQTFLRENDQIGVVDPTLKASYNPILAPYDLTAGGSYYSWHGRTDVKQLALYGEDAITAGAWEFNLGIRGDIYNGLTIQKQGEPRVGISYTVKKTGTVLRTSYARTQETPFNENLVLSSSGCSDPVLYAVFATLSDGSCSTNTVTPFNPGFRNEFHAGIEQSIGRHFVFNGEYIWKYTHNAYDFSVLGTTPITFPIEWHNSKIPGYAISAKFTEWRGLSAETNMSSVAARFFTPQLGGVGATPASANTAAGTSGILPFRIDHDEHFNQTTHVQYNLPFRKSMWYGFNWRYDSGLVAGAAPCYNVIGANTDCDPSTAITVNGQPGINLTGLSADQQFQAGLVCDDPNGGGKATPTNQLQQCTVAGLTSNLLKLPAINTEDADKNPSRIASRNLFDMAFGDDRIAHFDGDRYRIAARITAINITNKYALYNFLSTFSGTHYVTPRAITGEVSFHF
jgi:hypothetical protein